MPNTCRYGGNSVVYGQPALQGLCGSGFLPSSQLLLHSYFACSVGGILTNHMIGVLDNYRYPNEGSKVLSVSHLRFLVTLTSETLHPASFNGKVARSSECKYKAEGCNCPDGSFVLRPVVDISLRKAKHRLPTRAIGLLTPGLLLRHLVEEFSPRALGGTLDGP